MDKNLDTQTPGEEEIRVDILGWLGEAWEIFKKAPGLFVLTAFVFMLVMVLAQMIPWVGSLIVTGPMMVGFYIILTDQMAGRPFNLGRLFAGFQFFIPALIANILITVFTIFGAILLIIPGLIIGSWYILTYIFIVDRDMDFWTAMEASRKVAFNDIVGFTLFYVCLIILNFIGALFFFVGILVTIPVTTAATFVVYQRLVGVNKMLEPEDSAPPQHTPGI